MRTLRYFFKICFISCLVILIAISVYLSFLTVTYSRIENNLSAKMLKSDSDDLPKLKLNTEYKATTYNAMFGISDLDFSYYRESTFVDGQKKKLRGKSSKAISKEKVDNNISHIVTTALTNSDITLFQNIDENSTRSYHVDELNVIEKHTEDTEIAYLTDEHSRFFPYPILDPLGTTLSGKVIVSKYNLNTAKATQLPISSNFLERFFEQDYNLLVSRFNIEGSDKELIVYNVCLSKYDKNGALRDKQLDVLYNAIQEEAGKGNYVIAGGTFNYNIGEDVEKIRGNERVNSFISQFNADSLPKNFVANLPKNSASVKTLRSAARPAVINGSKYDNAQQIADFFITSKNVEAVSEVEDTHYHFSIHNPVHLTFKLVDKDAQPAPKESESDSETAK